jgi:hypothetical protein
VSWLSTPPFNTLPPFATTADESIEFGISYDKLELGTYEEATLENKVGSIDAARSFSIKRSSPVSVRVKDIDRLTFRGRSSSTCWPTASRSPSAPSSSRSHRAIATPAGCTH